MLWVCMLALCPLPGRVLAWCITPSLPERASPASATSGEVGEIVGCAGRNLGEPTLMSDASPVASPPLPPPMSPLPP